MSTYTSFPKPMPPSTDPTVALTFSQPASFEASTWESTFGFIPFGVTRRVQDELGENISKLEALPPEHGASTSKDVEEEDGKDAAWVPDEACKMCFSCDEAFTLMRRRHHCRVCGLVFCGSCSGNWVNGEPFGYGDGPVRACGECYDVFAHVVWSTTAPAVTTMTNKTKSNDGNQEEVGMKGSFSFLNDDATSSLLGSGEESPTLHQQNNNRNVQTMLTATSSFPARRGRADLLYEARERALAERFLELKKGGDVDVSELMRLSGLVCDRVRPDPIDAGDSLDASTYFVVTPIPGIGTNTLVEGAVLKKNVVHRRMRRMVTNPRIILVDGSIELERRSQQSKVTSIDKLLDQERIYLTLVVAKMAALKADVLLVSGSVAGVAQDLLLDRNVCVATQVTPTNLHWISRLTGAIVLPSVEHITRTRDPTGTCSTWRLETVNTVLDQSDKGDTYMFFEGCSPRRGCTVLLRGASSLSGLELAANCLKKLVEKRWTIRLEHLLWRSLDDTGLIRTCTGLPAPHVLTSGMVYGNFNDVDADFFTLMSERLDFSRVWLQGGSQTSPPSLVSRTFYSSQDRSLGEFLLRYCFVEDMSSASLLPSSLHAKEKWLQSESQHQQQQALQPSHRPVSMADNDLTLVFVHGFGRIRVSAERLPKAEAIDMQGRFPAPTTTTTTGATTTPMNNNNEEEDKLRIMTWGTCGVCGEHTSLRVVPRSVCGMSLARFLQSVFYCEGIRGPGCTHSLMHDYRRFFFRGEVVVSVEYEHTAPYRVYVTSKLARDNAWHLDSGQAVVEELLKLIPVLREEFVARVHKSNKMIKTRIQNECDNLFHRTMDLGAGTEHTVSRANALFRELYLCAVEWNKALTPMSTVQQQQSRGSGLKMSPLFLNNNPASSTSTSGPSSVFQTGVVVVDRSHLLHDIRENNGSSSSRGPSLSTLGNTIVSTPVTTSRRSLFSRRPSQLEIRDGIERLRRRSSLSQQDALTFLATTRESSSLPSTPRSENEQEGETPHPDAAALMSPFVLPERLVSGHPLLPSGRGNVVIPVLESEPTSWIAHALASNQYMERVPPLSESLVGFLTQGSISAPMGPISRSSSVVPPSAISSSQDASLLGLGSAVVGEAFPTPQPTPQLTPPLGPTPSSNNMTTHAPPRSVSTTSFGSADQTTTTMWRSDDHVRVGFSDASEDSPTQCTFSVTVYFAASFQALRALYLGNNNNEQQEEEDAAPERWFLESLSRCTPWKPTGGKTGAAFLKTLDDRFIVKTVSQEEFDMFREFAPKYFAHLGGAFHHQETPPSILVPFLGFFNVVMQSDVVKARHKQRVKSEGVPSALNNRILAVSPNVFWRKRPHVVYDLKGNTRNRMVSDPDPNAVRLDVNFWRDCGGVPLSLTPTSKAAVLRAVENDAAFLASVGVVDYSLLIGLCGGDSAELVVGIIDYLQLYNYKKMIESNLKAVSGASEPTVVSPSKYRARFVAAMDRFFVSSETPLLCPTPSTL